MHPFDVLWVDSVCSVVVRQALGAGSRHKEFKKRPLRSINIYFGPDFAIGVQLYAVYKAVRVQIFLETECLL